MEQYCLKFFATFSNPMFIAFLDLALDSPKYGVCVCITCANCRCKNQLRSFTIFVNYKLFKLTLLYYLFSGKNELLVETNHYIESMGNNGDSTSNL